MLLLNRLQTHLKKALSMKMNTWLVRRSSWSTGFDTSPHPITDYDNCLIFLFWAATLPFIISTYCRFISIPKDMGTFNCGAFVAGIVRVSATSISTFINHLVKILISNICFKGCFGWCWLPCCCNSSFCTCWGTAKTSNYHFNKVCRRGT